jgi:hypothetical protein
MSNRKIVAYLSHSYRPTDRALNMSVWRRLNERGIVFAVDPPNDQQRPMDVAFLERMMHRSDCFVAIVPDRRRRDAAKPTSGSRKAGERSLRPTAGWSPYQQLECRLALRAKKPMLVVAEENIEPGPVKDGIVYFTRGGGDIDLGDGFDREADKLRDRALVRLRTRGEQPKIAILRWEPGDTVWRQMSAMLERELGRHSAQVVSVDRCKHDHELLNDARGAAVLVVDMNPLLTPPHVVGLLHGDGIPLFRTCLIQEGQDSAQVKRELGLSEKTPSTWTLGQLPWPTLLDGYQVDERMEPVFFWDADSVEASAAKIVTTLAAHQARELDLETFEDGKKYFLTLRGNRVFISTPSQLIEESLAVQQSLVDAGFPAFHYKASDLKLAVAWAPQLVDEISRADLVVALITDDYWFRAECVDELALAIDRWERHQLLLQIYTASTKKLPGFLAEYQSRELIQGAEEMARIVTDDVRTRFGEGDQIGMSRDERDRLEALISRHILDNMRDEEVLVEICKIDPRDADGIQVEMQGAESGRARAGSLLAALSSGAQIERFCGAALGRLLLALRAVERKPETREWLSRLPARWRLFSGLHDIRAWHARRTRTRIGLSLSSSPELMSMATLVTELSGNRSDWLEKIRKMSETLGKLVDPETVCAIRAQPDARVVAATSVEHLAAPLDWADIQGLGYLCRVRPVIRQVTEPPGTRARRAIEDELDRGLTGPPRVLLFGHETAGLPNVRKEVDALQRLLQDDYERRGWPKECVRLVPSAEATKQHLKGYLDQGDYDIVHLAGHAGEFGGEAALQVLGKDDGAWVRAGELEQWLRTSLTKFVFLSCCSGAIPSGRSALCREILRAGVPEVVAYLWDIGDELARGFAERFYRAFLARFDAGQALFEARQGCVESNPLWAAAVLVKQPSNLE